MQVVDVLLGQAENLVNGLVGVDQAAFLAEDHDDQGQTAADAFESVHFFYVLLSHLPVLEHPLVDLGHFFGGLQVFVVEVMGNLVHTLNQAENFPVYVLERDYEHGVGLVAC